MNDSLVPYLLTSGALFVVGLIALYLWSIIWSYNDANRRGKNGMAVALLVALLSWPIGLLLWSIIRPENVKKNVVKKSLIPNNISSSFKSMPFVMKLLFGLSVFMLWESVSGFLRMENVNFSYFGHVLSKNYLWIWHLYQVSYSFVTLWVLLSRSISAIRKYVYFSFGILLILLPNTLFRIMTIPLEQRGLESIVHVVSYAFAGGVLFYFLNQRKYFHKQ